MIVIKVGKCPCCGHRCLYQVSRDVAMCSYCAGVKEW